MGGVIHIENINIRIVLLEIDNPPMNALGGAMLAAFMTALDQVEADEQVRAVVVTGRGRAFCGGADLKDTGEDGEDIDAFGRLLDRLDTVRVPVIAAVNGWCVGGGFELALCADIRIASSGARFVCAGVNVGLIASAYRLPRLIGVSRAKAMLLTGLPYDAAEAERFGVVTAVHPPEALKAAALALAARIASRAPLSVEATKRIAGRAPDLSPQDAGALQDEAIQRLRRSEDHQAALAAFRAKREPVFRRR
jgi:enoyl-CoA hydratase